MPDDQELTPQELLDASRALGLALRLLLLDKVWTREAQRASNTETRDPDRLQELDLVVDEMEGLLQDCGKIAPTIAAIGNSKNSLLQNRFQELGTGTFLPGISAVRSKIIFGRLDHHVKEKGNGSAPDFLAQQADRLTKLVDTEVAALRAEQERIRSGGGSDGDMSEEAQHTVGGLALGAGLLLGPEAAGAVLIVAEVVDCLT